MKMCSLLLMIAYANICRAADDDVCKMQPYSTCRLAADKLVDVLPKQVQIQQGISAQILAEQLERIGSKRVENRTLIEDILHQDSPLQSEGAVLLLLQVSSKASRDAADAQAAQQRSFSAQQRLREDALHSQEARHYAWSSAFFGMSLLTLAAVLFNSGC